MQSIWLEPNIQDRFLKHQRN